MGFLTTKSIELTDRILLISIFFSLVTINLQAVAQEKTIEEIAESARDSTVLLTVKHIDPSNPNNVCSEVNQGTAFLISANGYALTASHNFRLSDNCKNFTKLQIEGRVGYPSAALLSAELVARDDQTDTGVIKFAEGEKDYSQVSFCDHDNPSAGKKLIAFGFPKGTSFAPLPLTYSNSDGDFGMWVVSGDLTHGMSGGPVYDFQGNVIGLVKGGLRNTPAVRLVVPLRHTIDMIEKSGRTFGNCSGVDSNLVQGNACVNGQNEELIKLLNFRARRLLKKAEELLGDREDILVGEYVDDFTSLHKEHVCALNDDDLIYAYEVLREIYKLPHSALGIELKDLMYLIPPNKYNYINYDYISWGQLFCLYTSAKLGHCLQNYIASGQFGYHNRQEDSEVDLAFIESIYRAMLDDNSSDLIPNSSASDKE